MDDIDNIMSKNVWEIIDSSQEKKLHKGLSKGIKVHNTIARERLTAMSEDDYDV